MTRRTTLIAAGIVIAVLAVVAGPTAADLFLPERATTVNDADVADEAVALKTGSFSGADAAHTVSGTVTLFRDGDGYFLLFEEYDQTQGPDVFVYLTPEGDPESRAAVNAGVKVLIDGGADGGESTKEGTFVQRLPADVEAEQYTGVSIWCDAFSVPFGSAALDPV